LLLNLAQFHIFKAGENQIDFDSASSFINQAKQLIRLAKSRDADGYLLLTESYLIKEEGRKSGAAPHLQMQITANREVVEKGGCKILESSQTITYVFIGRHRPLLMKPSMYYDLQPRTLCNLPDKKFALVKKLIYSMLYQQTRDSGSGKVAVLNMPRRSLIAK
jgi:hypothetical protein